MYKTVIVCVYIKKKVGYLKLYEILYFNKSGNAGLMYVLMLSKFSLEYGLKFKC